MNGRNNYFSVRRGLLLAAVLYLNSVKGYARYERDPFQRVDE